MTDDLPHAFRHRGTPNGDPGHYSWHYDSGYDDAVEAIKPDYVTMRERALNAEVESARWHHSALANAERADRAEERAAFWEGDARRAWDACRNAEKAFEKADEDLRRYGEAKDHKYAALSNRLDEAVEKWDKTRDERLEAQRQRDRLAVAINRVLLHGLPGTDPNTGEDMSDVLKEALTPHKEGT